jgi:hypothetical protein
MTRLFKLAGALAFAALLAACSVNQSNDSKRAEQQEQSIADGQAQVPAPAIVNWNELRMFKTVMERRDQANLSTWTYTKNLDGKYTFVCESIGFGIPYNTRSNNPQHYELVTTHTGVSGMSNAWSDGQGGYVWGEHAIMPQAEPNGLFIPESAKGTWNTCLNPETGKATITYQEEDVAVFEYRLPDEMVEGFHPAPVAKPAATSTASSAPAN